VSDETTVTRHEPMVLERFTLVPGGGRENYREETVCSTCWIKNQDDCLPETVRAPWPCEVVRTRREFVGYLRWRQCDRHAEMTINDAVKASRDALPWVGQKCERCTEDDLAAMIAGNPEATRLASQLKASGDRNLSTVLENARLRERVAVLEGDTWAYRAVLARIVGDFTSGIYCANCGEGVELCRCTIDLARTVLLRQADEAGGGAG
jgi:hypothetical protein